MWFICHHLSGPLFIALFALFSSSSRASLPFAKKVSPHQYDHVKITCLYMASCLLPTVDYLGIDTWSQLSSIYFFPGIIQNRTRERQKLSGAKPTSSWQLYYKPAQRKRQVMEESPGSLPVFVLTVPKPGYIPSFPMTSLFNTPSMTQKTPLVPKWVWVTYSRILTSPGKVSSTHFLSYPPSLELLHSVA
jgi:hypothetical protein